MPPKKSLKSPRELELVNDGVLTASAVDEPQHKCPLCPRLSEFIAKQRSTYPDWHNGPVRSFGDYSARLLIVGLAPGLRGANRTGRPFTGDFAGELLYSTLNSFGFSRGQFAARPDDGLELVDCAITNAVRCVPPENKPLPSEIKTCRQFLAAKLLKMQRLEVVVVLGRVAHDAMLGALDARKSAHPFSHGGVHEVPRAGRAPLTIFDSYHCSRYNTNTGVLTPEMFTAVFAAVRARLS